MSGPKVISAEQAAALVPSGAVCSISASSGLGCPDAVLRALGQRFAATGQPRGLTTVHPIAAGDMYGIDGIDHLAQPGLLKRIIAGSLPSGPSALPTPKIWRMIDDNQVEAYNLPSGILFHLHREAAAKRPGVLTKVGLDTFVDPRRQGGRMNRGTTEDIVRVVEFDGGEWLFYRAIAVDVAIIRATTADQRGNLSMEHEGAYLGALDLALAARNHGGLVIAQVKRLAQESLPAQSVRVPQMLVDYVVVAPEQKQTTQTVYDPAISGERPRSLAEVEPVPWGVDKVIARRAALELRAGEAVNLGFGISALVPYVLLEEGHPEAVTWVIEQGAVGGLPLTGFQFGCAANPQAIMASPDQFTYFQGGGFHCSLLSFLEVDGEGNVNVSRLAKLPHVTAGAGGFIDITACARRLIFSGYFSAGAQLSIGKRQLQIGRQGKARKFVPAVEHVTFSGRCARAQGQQTLFVTERCVLSLEQDGLTVIELAPGVDLQRDVLAQADCPLQISAHLRLMDERLFRPELMGLKLKEQ